MPDSALLDLIKKEILDVFTETFESVQGIYLDRQTSLFETLETITAAEASRPVSSTCASIAAQVEHVRFYIDHLSAYMRGENPGKADWGEIWRTIEAVTPEEWEASKARLKESHQRTVAFIQTFDNWEQDERLSGALAIVVHTAYHLGEIRQAMCMVKTS
jgi:hypothetical protein